MYLVTAYRWGWLNNHQYHVYAGGDKTKALALAQAENDDRGGKYGCAVWCFDEDGTGYTLESHFPSVYGESEPYHNHRLVMFERLGHFLYNYAHGSVLLPDPEQEGVLKRVEMDPPEWAVSEVKRAEGLANAMQKTEASARAWATSTAREERNKRA